MKVAVLEYLCGGGLCKAGADSYPLGSNELFEPLFREGLSMLCALACDLSLCGHEVHLCLDQKALVGDGARSLGQIPSHAHVHYVANGWKSRWREIALQCDRVIVIAPELHDELNCIVAELRSAGAQVVASDHSFIHATSDKLLTANCLVQAGVPHPTTQLLSDFRRAKQRRESSNQIGDAVPVTLKRRDGAGCADMMVFCDGGALMRWLEREPRTNWCDDQWIVQTWLSGRAASVAIIGGDRWQIVGTMEQRITLRSDERTHGAWAVEYCGGAGPIESLFQERSVAVPWVSRALCGWVNQVRSALPDGGYGWIGIDLVVCDTPEGSSECVLIEVNPRLTTSYLGYRQWYGHRLADCILGCIDLSELQHSIPGELKPIAFSAS